MYKRQEYSSSLDEDSSAEADSAEVNALAPELTLEGTAVDLSSDTVLAKPSENTDVGANVKDAWSSGVVALSVVVSPVFQGRVELSARCWKKSSSPCPQTASENSSIASKA